MTIRRLVSIALLLGAAFSAACGSIATPQPTVDLTAAALGATATPIPSATPVPPTETPIPPTATPLPPTATLQPTAEGAAETTPEAIATHDMSNMGSSTAALDPRVTGNAENGKAVFNKFYDKVSFACATCHHFDSQERLIGPGLWDISNRAAHADHLPAGQEDTYQYIYDSIVNPSAYVVPDYPDGLMPQTWAQVLTEAEIQDVIAYLYTLKP